MDIVQNNLFSLLQRTIGLTTLRFYPDKKTIDMQGGRDQYNIKDATIEQVGKLVHPDDEEMFLSQYDKHTEKDPQSFHFKVRVLSHLLKCYRYFKVEFFPCFDEETKKTYYDGYCIDITEEELTIKEKRDEIHKLMIANEAAAKGERNIITALANISHDLRSPVGTIMGFSELLAMTDDAAERSEYNQIIQDTGKRILSMVNDILDMNKLQTGEMKFTIKTFDIEKMLKNIYEVYQLQFKSKGLQLIIESHNHPFRINTDEMRLREIIDNYLSNAIKHTEQGSVTIKYEEFSDGICIHVIDTGEGISEDNCSKVFNRFEMLNTKVKGHGIGLNICKLIARALGGEVGVYSDLGKGADFWVRIYSRECKESDDDYSSL